MKIEEAKKIDLVEYLTKLGFKGDRKGKNVWYLSPLHDEKTPSFKVNTQLNLWYDFGNGDKKHGNIIDFGILYFKCSVADFLRRLDDDYLHSLKNIKPFVKSAEADKPELLILEVKPLHSYPLLKYLQERRIPQAIANEFCKEVHYEVHGKQYYSIGFQNDAGGYALRNAYSKAASMPNDFTFKDNGAKDLVVFEGFFDFLSYKALYHGLDEPHRNALILNSASFFEKSLPILERHEVTYSFLDNDKTGNKLTEQAAAHLKERFKDERTLYQGYNDLNDYLKSFGQQQRSKLGHRL